MTRKLSLRLFFCALFLFVASGCTPAVVGGGAVGGYKVGTDERSAGTMLDDTTITTKVKSALIGEKDIKARNIDVDTVNGVVALSGFVDSQLEIDRALAVARSVSGVRQVKNELRVGSRTVGQAMEDKLLGAKIKARLVEEPGIKSLNIDVDVYAGMVTLTGTVKSQEQKKTVFAIARSVEGTKGIVDNLQIR